MKFVNQYTKEEFDNADACLLSEKKYMEQQKKESEEKKDLMEKAKVEAEARKTRKKELADEVEKASKILDEAYEHYEICKQKVEDLKEEYTKRMHEVIDPAKEAIKIAKKNQMNAVIAFNQEFGAYKTTLTNADAEKEFNKLMSSLWFPSFIDLFF